MEVLVLLFKKEDYSTCCLFVSIELRHRLRLDYWVKSQSVMLHSGFSCSLSRALDGHIIRRSIISSCQSASEIVKRC